MAKSNLISGRAPGWWGGNPHKRVMCDNVIDKVMSLNLDKLMTLGLPFAVWREAVSLRDDLLSCSCVKDTAKQADVPCLTCYGTGKIPGYFKVGTRTYWASTIDPGWTLTNIVVDKDNRPFRFKLADGQTSGSAVSASIVVDMSGATGAWESKVDGFTRDGGANSSIIVEFSTDDGTTWQAMDALPSITATTSIRFRITISRNTPNVKSPMFEIVRVRFPTMRDIRGELAEPVVRFIPTWDRNAESRTQHGWRIESVSKRFWTVPLTFFDQTMPRETDLARLVDDVLVEVRYGAAVGTRYAVTDFNYSDTFGEFTRQEFGLRQFSGEPGEIVGEHAYRVF